MKTTFLTRLMAVLLFALGAAVGAFAGGPLFVGGPQYGIEGAPFTWNPAAMPIQYRVDPGPMSKNGATIVISNQQGVQRVAAMFGVWQSVSTAAVSFRNVGALLPAGSYTGTGSVTTVPQYDDLESSCANGQQNPIIFDPDGSLINKLGMDDGVVGFAGACSLDMAGFIHSAHAMMNGKWLNGTMSGVPADMGNIFDEAITHEIGHLLGLDHSQINTDSSAVCYNLDEYAGRPLMYPYLTCSSSRKTSGVPILAADDVAWLSKLYPSPSYATSYGTISGYILFPDGVTQAQEVNVIARQVDDVTTQQNESRRVAVSVISGFRFTGNPGQSVTANYLPCTSPSSYCKGGYLDNNTGGDRTGSRDPMMIGYYEIPVPPGTYTVEVEQVLGDFVGGSGMGPLDLHTAVVPKYYNDSETPVDDPTLKTPVTVGPGQTLKNINIRLNGNYTRFDSYESGADLMRPSSLRIFEAEAGRCA